MEPYQTSLFDLLAPEDRPLIMGELPNNLWVAVSGPHPVDLGVVCLADTIEEANSILQSPIQLPAMHKVRAWIDATA